MDTNEHEFKVSYSCVLACIRGYLSPTQEQVLLKHLTYSPNFENRQK